PPGKRKTLPVETTRHAFAYVFAGGGKFCNASGPLAVPTEGVGWADTAPPREAGGRSLVLFDRGDEGAVQAGDGGRRLLLGSGEAAPGARGVVRPDRDEHAGAAPAGVRGTPGGDVPEADGAGVAAWAARARRTWKAWRGTASDTGGAGSWRSTPTRGLRSWSSPAMSSRLSPSPTPGSPSRSSHPASARPSVTRLAGCSTTTTATTPT